MPQRKERHPQRLQTKTTDEDNISYADNVIDDARIIAFIPCDGELPNLRTVEFG